MKKKLSIAITIVFLVSVLSFKNYPLVGQDSVVSFSQNFGSFFSSSVQGIKNKFFFWTAIRGLSDENALLKLELAQRESEIALLLEARKENDNLKKLLGFVDSNKADWLGAEIATYDPNNFIKSVTINKGEKDGVKKGAAVISEGYLIGKVSEVKPTYSRILLITDSNSAIPSIVQGTSVSGLVRGLIGFGLSMDSIPQGEKIIVGDIIITSGLGGDLPRGLIIGKVEEVESSDNAIFQKARLRSSADFRNLRHVLVLK
jgi:rod shape-determining protein MreC